MGVHAGSKLMRAWHSGAASDLKLPPLYDVDDVVATFEAAGFERDQIQINPSVVRGLEYYTGPVFEAELLMETKDEDGRRAGR